jgi:hypothetical protein
VLRALIAGVAAGEPLLRFQVAAALQLVGARLLMAAGEAD